MVNGVYILRFWKYNQTTMVAGSEDAIPAASVYIAGDVSKCTLVSAVGLKKGSQSRENDDY